MDVLTFIAEMTKALGWPLAVVILVLALRRPISSVIPLLQKLKYKDIELEFGRRVAEVEEEARGELPSADRRLELPAQRPDPTVELARTSPRAAVLHAWVEVERAALEAAERAKIPVNARGTATPGRVLRALREAKLLDPSVSGILEDLRVLRNQAAHASDFAISEDAAVHYARLASDAADYLRNLQLPEP